MSRDGAGRGSRLYKRFREMGLQLSIANARRTFSVKFSVGLEMVGENEERVRCSMVLG